MFVLNANFSIFMLTYYFSIFRFGITNLYVELWKTFNFILCVMFTMCVCVSENLVVKTIFKMHQIMSHLFMEIWLQVNFPIIGVKKTKMVSKFQTGQKRVISQELPYVNFVLTVKLISKLALIS